MRTDDSWVNLALHDRTLRVVLAGDVDCHVVDPITLSGLHSVGEVDDVIVDLTAARLIDSQAIALLLQLRQLAGSPPVHLHGAGERIRNVLHVCGVESLFSFVDGPVPAGDASR